MKHKNVTFETTDARTNNCNRRTVVLERSVEKYQGLKPVLNRKKPHTYVITKTEKLLIKKKKKKKKKNSDIFHISAQNIEPRQGISNEYPHSMFFSKIKK